MSFLISLAEYGVDAIADLACVGLVLLYAPYMSIKAIRSNATGDDTQWLSFWIIYQILNVFDRFFGAIIDRFLPFYYSAKLVFILWLMFGNGAKSMFETVVNPFMAQYEGIIDEQLKKATDPAHYTELQRLINDPEALRKLANGATEYIAKYGKEAYDIAVKAAESKTGSPAPKKEQ